MLNVSFIGKHSVDDEAENREQIQDQDATSKINAEGRINSAILSAFVPEHRRIRRMLHRMHPGMKRCVAVMNCTRTVASDCKAIRSI